MPEDKSCWKCGWNRLSGITLLDLCWWFYKDKGIAKEIPRHIADKGCRFWTAEKQDIDVLKKVPKIIEEEL